MRQLWKGNLNDELIQAAGQGEAEKDWEEMDASPHGVLISQRIREKVSFALETRPKDIPQGAAAIRRQLGMQLAACPSQRVEKGEKVPKRGDIWPATVDAIAM